MARTCKRTSSRQSWDENSMLRAIKAVTEKNYELENYMQKFQWRVKSQNPKKKTLVSYKSVFNEKQENEIYENVIDLKKRFFGVTI